jgi:hypothetical protein
MNRALIEGIGVQVIPGDKRRRPNAADIQKAIDMAGASYRRRFGVPPTHVALPADMTIVLSALNLYTLSQAHPAQGGIVIVGRVTGNGGTPRRDPEPPTAAIGEQMELFREGIVNG